MKKHTLFSFIFILSFILLGFNVKSVSAYDEGLGGCNLGYKYNTQTGQLCPTTNAVVGCQTGYLFSPVTGQSCSGVNVSQDNSSDVAQFNNLFKSNFKIGVKSNDVKLLQQFLKDKDYYFRKIDGKYGKITARAIKDFQDDNDINVTTPPTQIACTMEAKLCFDGKTYVSRTGPSCEFSACPTSTPSCYILPTGETNCGTNFNNPPVISGIDGPQTLNTNQQGTWSITASDSSNSGNLSYSVIWGDEAYKTYSSTNISAALGSQISTFTHSYSQAGIYTPKFTVTNFDGKTAQTSLSVNVGGVITTDKIPVIYSVTPSSASVGSQVVITGQNFTGFEGDKDIWLENSNGEAGIVKGDRTNDNAGNLYGANSTRFILPSQVCTKDTSFSGLSCPKWISIVPGQYKIYVKSWDKISNKVNFTVPTPTCPSFDRNASSENYNNIKCQYSLKYGIFSDAVNAFKTATNSNMNVTEISFYVPGKVPRKDGNPYFIGRGTVNASANDCVVGYMNLVTGTTESHHDVCVIYD